MAGGASATFPSAVWQRGAVLLQAMVVVTLVAVIAAAAMWQQWRVVEVEGAQRTRQQIALMLDGGVDYARLILYLDARGAAGATMGVDHLDEPWAVPLQETRLSTFIDGQGTDSADDGLASQTFMTGSLSDMHARLNVRNLGDADQAVRERTRAQFERLFERLGLPLSELDMLGQQAELAWRASDTAPSATDAPLPPRGTAQLVWLGLSPQTVARLEPYVSVLPMRTRININTAAAEVLQASGALDYAQAQKLVQARRGHHFASVSAANDILGVQAFTAEDHAISSHYFEISGWVRVGEAVVHERVLVRRDGRTVRTIWRERVPTTAAAAQRVSAAP